MCDAGFSGDGYNCADIDEFTRQFCVMVRSSRRIIPLMSGFAGACVTRDSQVMATTARILTGACQFCVVARSSRKIIPLMSAYLQVRV